MKKRIIAVIAAAVTIFASAGGASAKTVYYRVVKGDSLWKIASMFKVGLNDLKKSNPQQKETESIKPGQVINVEQPDPDVSDYEKQVVTLVNEQRAKYGLKPLTLNTQLSRVARAKSQDMKDKGYFSHTSPTYGSPFDMMRKFGITYRTAGENIAKGQRTPQAVVNAWMNSSGHRANILNASFTQIGVGYVAQGNYWTQMFTG